MNPTSKTLTPPISDRQKPLIETRITNILIDGATGYIGSHLVAALKQLGLENLNVRCLVRRCAKEKDIDFLRQNIAQITQADLGEDEQSLAPFFDHVDVACHLIGSIAPRHGETSELIHVEQTRRFVQHCQMAKVGKIIMVSACGASAQSNIAYQHTKWQAEQIIKESGLSAIILRPSLIIGKTTGLRNSKLIVRLQDLIQNKKIVPLVAGGNNKLQPLFIGDLIQALINSIFETSGSTGENTPILELGGSDIITLRELTILLMKVMSTEKSIVSLPAAAAFALASLSETMQAVPVLSRDQVKLSQQDNICTNNKLSNLIKRAPITVEEALHSYKFAH